MAAMSTGMDDSSNETPAVPEDSEVARPDESSSPARRPGAVVVVVMVATILFSGWIAWLYISGGGGEWIQIGLALSSVVAAGVVLVRIARGKAPGPLAWIAPLLGLVFPVILVALGLLFVLSYPA